MCWILKKCPMPQVEKCLSQDVYSPLFLYNSYCILFKTRMAYEKSAHLEEMEQPWWLWQKEEKKEICEVF